LETPSRLSDLTPCDLRASIVTTIRILRISPHDELPPHRPPDWLLARLSQRFLKKIEALFVQLLLVARKMGALKMGMALNRSKIHANASRHSAPSYEHAGKNRDATEGRSYRASGQG
jgi:hypothetical protein